ncbi:hypothetical protein KL920_002339 [Ogataea angusta]|nr:hypothetical protein KL920_002339 [Ogataea angusta]
MDRLVSAFQFERLLSSDSQLKTIALLGTIDGQQAILQLEKSHFDTARLPDLPVQEIREIASNDVYHWAMTTLQQSADRDPAAKLNLIYPATDTHIRKNHAWRQNQMGPQHSVRGSRGRPCRRQKRRLRAHSRHEMGRHHARVAVSLLHRLPRRRRVDQRPQRDAHPVPGAHPGHAENGDPAPLQHCERPAARLRALPAVVLPLPHPRRQHGLLRAGRVDSGRKGHSARGRDRHAAVPGTARLQKTHAHLRDQRVAQTMGAGAQERCYVNITGARVSVQVVHHIPKLCFSMWRKHSEVEEEHFGTSGQVDTVFAAIARPDL